MMLINMLEIAQQLEIIDQAVHYDIDTNSFQLIQGAEEEDEDAQCLMDNLSFKEIAMYATGLAANICKTED